MIEIVDDFIDLELREEINKLIKNKQLPLYYNTDSVEGDGKSFLCHVMKLRNEDTEDHDNGVRSPLLQIFIRVLAQYHRKYKPESNYTVEINRAAINVTYPNGHSEGVWHKDHEYPHKHFVLFLNNPEDPKAYLEIQDEEGIYKVVPQQWKGVVMDDYLHRVIYPKVGTRWVLVITFKEYEV